MTLTQVSKQVYDLAFCGYINSQKFTKAEFANLVNAMFRDGADSYIFEIALPDGKWFAEIAQYRNGEFDYIIPDNRSQEARIIDKLLRKGETK